MNKMTTILAVILTVIIIGSAIGFTYQQHTIDTLKDDLQYEQAQNNQLKKTGKILIEDRDLVYKKYTKVRDELLELRKEIDGKE